MKGIDKKACLDFLEPLCAPNSDSGLFLLPKLRYIVRSAVKIAGHRRLLILCLYVRGDTAGNKPKLAYTVFQSGESFITYDHDPESKTRWRSAMLANMDKDYYFSTGMCAFFSRQDEKRVISFCRPYVPEDCLENGFTAISRMQQQIRDKETLRRKKNRERKIRSRLSGLLPLPRDTEHWLRREVLPAYFFYDYKKGRSMTTGVCSACGETVELANVRHNAKGVCPHCGRELTMKSNGKHGHIWERATASVVQKFGRDALIVRIIKAYLTWPKQGDSKLDVYEETRIIVSCQENGRAVSEVYHHSNDSVGISRWKNGYPPVAYLYGQNFNAETCGALYCKNLSRALKGTPWQYSQLEAFYRAIQEDMEVLPYLEAYREIPAIEFFVKLGLSWLATHVIYGRDGKKLINPDGKNLRDVLQIDPSDLPWLQRPGAGVRELQILRTLRREGYQPSEELFRWLAERDITQLEGLEKAIHYTSPHKMIRYLNTQFSLGSKNDYRGSNGILSDYKDYLGFCEELHYDLKNEFVLFPRYLQQAHDQAQGRVKQRQVEKFDTQIASQRKRLKRQYQFKSGGRVVLPPHSAQEIVVEGQALHHCVGRYAEQMAEGDCAILFLRQEQEVETPYYTVEVQGDNIIQVRGAHNCAPTPEVKKFLNAWEEKKHLKGVA